MPLHNNKDVVFKYMGLQNYVASLVLCSFTGLGKVLQRFYWSKALCTAVWHQNGGIYFHFGAKHTCTNFAISHLKEIIML